MSDPFRLLVTGSRHWPHRLAPFVEFQVVARVARELGGPEMPRGVVLVVGDCPTGVDRIAAEAVRNSPYGDGVEPWATVERHVADWGRYGGAAGPLRNAEMVKAGADLCLAFPTAASRGTWNCLTQAVKAGIPAMVYPLEEAERWTERLREA